MKKTRQLSKEAGFERIVRKTSISFILIIFIVFLIVYAYYEKRIEDYKEEISQSQSKIADIEKESQAIDERFENKCKLIRIKNWTEANAYIQGDVKEVKKYSKAKSNKKTEIITADTSEITSTNKTSKKQISVTNNEFNWIVQAVQHEVGNSATYYPGYDFDVIQKYMASAIINRIGKAGFANTASDVLSQPGQFMSVEALSKFDPYEQRTISNVKAVINGEFNSSDVLFEMSFVSQDPSYCQAVMEQQVGNVSPVYSAISADGRYLMFAAKA